MRSKYEPSKEALQKIYRKLDVRNREIFPIEDLDELQNYMDKAIFINGVSADATQVINYSQNAQYFFHINYKDKQSVVRISSLMTLEDFFGEFTKDGYYWIFGEVSFPKENLNLVSVPEESLIDVKYFIDVEEYGSACKTSWFKKDIGNTSIEGSCGGVSLLEEKFDGGGLSLIEE